MNETKEERGSVKTEREARGRETCAYKNNASKGAVYLSHFTGK